MTRDKDQSLFRGQGPPPSGPAADGPLGLTNECLAPARLWSAALACTEGALTPAERDHLNQCDRCRSAFARVQQAVQASAAPRRSEAPAAGEPDLPPVEPPRRQPLSRLQQPGEQRLVFEDGLTALVQRHSDGRHWLRIEHPAVLSPTPVRVTIAGPELMWEGVVLLRPANDRSAGQVLIEPALPAGAGERLLGVEAVEEDVPAEGQLPLWRAALAGLRRDDPEALETWRSWAEEVLAGVAERPVRWFLDAVHRCCRKEPTMLTVCASGHGHFPTINEAIQSAPPSSKLLIRPGRYRESVLLDRPLELIGDGLREAIVVEALRGPSLTVATTHGHVRGLSLRGGSPATVELGSGAVKLEDCLIHGGRLAGVRVYGGDTSPTLRRCRIQDSRGIGVLFHDEARGRLEDCEVFANGRRGVEVTVGAEPFLLRCHIHDNGRHGVVIGDTGRAQIDECKLAGHTGADIVVWFEGVGCLRQCWLRQGPGSGLVVRDMGDATLVECQVLDHDGFGVEVRDGCTLTLRRGKVAGNRRGAVEQEPGGRVANEDCEVVEAAPAVRAATR